MTNPFRRHYVATAFGLMISLGMWEGSKGVILPHFLADLSVTGAVGAAIFSSGAIGFSLGALGFGAVTQRFGLKRVFVAGYLLSVASGALFITSRNPVYLYGFMIFQGAGFALLDMSASLPISILYGQRQGGILNTVHGFFGIGSLLAPMLVVSLLAMGATWRLPVMMIILLYGIWVALFLYLPELPLPEPDRAKGSRRGLKPLARDPLVWAAALSLAASVPVELGLGMWLPSYLQMVKGLPEVQSAFFTTLFYAGFTVTRLGAIWFVDRFGHAASVVGLALVGAVGLGLLMVLPGQWAWIAIFAGVGAAIVFPITIAMVAVRYPDLVNQAYALMYSTAAFVMIFAAPAMGLLAEHAGLQAALWIPMGSLGAIILLMTYYGWASSRAAKAGYERQNEKVLR